MITLIIQFKGELHDSQEQVEQQSLRINLLEKQNKKLDVELGLIKVIFIKV